jgi:hypothetical protein
MCNLTRTRWCMQVKVSFEVATLDVSTPLVVALDGGATILATSTTVDLLPEVCRLVASHRRAMHLAAPGVPQPRTAYVPLMESTTAAPMTGTTPPGVAC